MHHSYETGREWGNDGAEIDITVSYDYTPAEPAISDPDDMRCGPGCAAEVELLEVLGPDGADLLPGLSDEDSAVLAAEVLEHHDESNGAGMGLSVMRAFGGW